MDFIVDENVSWKEHAKLVGKKLSRSFGVIHHLKFRFSKKILKMMYHSIFHPHLYYGCSIWASNSISCYKRVQIIQNKTIQIVSPIQHTQKQLFLLRALLGRCHKNVGGRNNADLDLL